MIWLLFFSCRPTVQTVCHSIDYCGDKFLIQECVALRDQELIVVWYHRLQFDQTWICPKAQCQDTYQIMDCHLCGKCRAQDADCY